MTTANKITLIRIAMIPVFVALAIYYGESIQRGAPLEWQRFAAIIVFLLAAVSDGLDGYVARRYNQRSRLGVVLDPIADKGLLLSGIITLSVSNWAYEFPAWFPVLVVARDAVIVIGTLTLHFLNGSVHVRPSWMGKTATALQMVAIVGRPNVGKSALFNRLAGRKISIVHDMPGVTRDRITANCKLGNDPFEIIDTGGIGANVDASFTDQVHAEVDIALGSADVLL